MSDSRTPNALDVRIGQRVRTRRIEIGMGQEKLAELLGVTFQQVQKYEKGVNRIASSRLAEVADALEMPVAAFYDRPKFKTNDTLQDALDLPDVVRALIALSKMRPNLRKKAVELIETLE